MLKEKIYDKIVINRECAIHDPDNLQKFWISTEATKLFNTIINSVKNALH